MSGPQILVGRVNQLTYLGGESEPINMAVFDNKTMIDIV